MPKPSSPAPRARAAVRPSSPSIPPIVVRRSAIQGSGVFATHDIAKGERIIEYVGERITHAQADERYDDESMQRHHTFLFSLDEETCIDAAVDGNDARFINHSCAPNAWSSADRGRIFIIAGKAIPAGEEIFYDYAYTIEPGDTLDKLKRLYPCLCGAPNCRGTLAEVPKEKKKAATRTASATKKEHGRPASPAKPENPAKPDNDKKRTTATREKKRETRSATR